MHSHGCFQEMVLPRGDGRCFCVKCFQDDPELDEEGQAALGEARELREQANALAHHARGKETAERHEILREAVTMYCRANELMAGKAWSGWLIEMSLGGLGRFTGAPVSTERWLFSPGGGLLD